MTVSHNNAPSHRDLALEDELQKTLDSGNSVWVVGDVHGYHSTLQNLITKIDLSDEDKLVSLGDMIDRGPDSASVLRMFRDTNSFHAIRGNHEDMMLRCLSRGKNKYCKSWLKYGGVETLMSFDLTPEDKESLAGGWCDFLSNCPTEIVLDRHRLIHAGINPLKAHDEQTDNDRLWSRSIFQFESAPDPGRQVLIGHTPTQEIEGHQNSQPWHSKFMISDGRPSVIALDTGICKPEEDLPTLTAIDLSSGESIQVSRSN